MKKALHMIMAVLLLVGMLGTQVSAETGVTPTSQPTTGSSTFTFKSTLSVPADTLVPNVTVGYSISGEAADGSGRIAGPAGASIGNATFSDTDSGTSISKDVTVTFPANTFQTVGIYRYKITQTIPANSGVVAVLPTIQYLDVFVQNNAGGTGLEVAYFVLASTANNTATSTSYTGKSDGFQNTYDSHTLTVKKEVTGNQGDKTKEFEFPITITNSEGTTKKYNYTITGGTGTSSGTFTSGTGHTISLKHGETIEITGLTAQDTYNVSETAVNGYTTAYKIGSGSETSYTAALTGTIAADTLITFINTKNVNTPTGVILTFMPYILMIAAGFVVAAVFLRRKRR